MAGADDLALLERVFFSLGSADTDDQLETRLAKFLPPVLLKLCSPDEVVRKKVMELLIHVNKRLKSRPRVLLPVDALLQQYQDPESSPFVTNFSILYIKMGFPRLSIEAQAERIPTLINCLQGKPPTQQDSLLQLLTPVLGHVTFPDNLERRAAVYSLKDRPATKALLLDYLLDVLIFPYSSPISQPVAVTQPPNTPTPTGSDQAVQPPTNQPPVTAPPPAQLTAAPRDTPSPVPPGMSEYAYKRVVGDCRMSPDALEKAKMGILRYLAGDIFPEQDVICLLVIAASDTRHSVATFADMELKRIAGGADWNDPVIVTKLFDLFLGTILLKGQESSVKKNHVRSAVSTRVKMKIFPQILRSREAANAFPRALQAVFECMYGANTNKKLKKLAVQFVHHLCLYCRDENLSATGQVLMTGMLNLIRDNPDDAKLRNLAYVAVGKLGQRLPTLVHNNISLAQRLFDALSQEDSETRLGVQEALAILSATYRNMDDHNKSLMEALIIQNFEKDDPQARIMAVKYSQAVFPPDHVSSRYLLLLACGDVKEEIYSEAVKALRARRIEDDSPGTAEKQDAQPHLPKFGLMVNYITKKARERLSNNQTYPIGTHVLPFNPVTYAEMLVYLRMCLANDAGCRSNMESVSTMREDSPVIGRHINWLLAGHTGPTGPVQQYVTLIIQLVRAIGGPPAMFCLLEVVATARSQLAAQFVEHLEWIKAFVFNSKLEMRDLAGQLYSIIITHTRAKTDVQNIVDKFVSNFSSKTFEIQHGSMLAAGHMISQQAMFSRGSLQLEDMETSQSGYEDCVINAVTKIVSFLKDRDEQLLSGACATLSEIGRSRPLPLPPGEESDAQGEITRMSVVKDLLAVKKKEWAAACLGCLCVGEDDFPHRRYVISQLMESVQSKQVELQFGIGEALVNCAQGSSSPAGRDLWLQTEADFQSTATGEGDLEWYLTRLLTQYVPNKNPFLRQASCIWLLTLVKKCGSNRTLQAVVGDIQAAFMKLLSENDEMTQDVASKGLGLVYENCTEDQKKSLVQELVDTLTTGKRQTHKVEGDTQVFDQGALGSAPDGGGLSTYKELCSIANDLNQPDLIYKFMHLANHNAMWNSRKGAAFGFSTIAAQAGEQLAPYLSQIVPKLYRYQFDPNPKIQTAMSSIWHALVKDNKKTVDTFLQEILRDLIRNLTSNQWRVRESSCLAVNDLLRGRQLDDVVEDLPELWEACLRVRDDIKESVRVAAEAACKTLTRASVRICDVSSGKVGERATSLVLPCLLTSLHSPAEEVRAIGLSTILKISKTAGVLLKPHIPVLVVALLEAVSGLEPQMMNYLSLHANSSLDSQDRIDTVRIAASKMSPMMETVNLCVQYVDESVLKELVPRLTDLIRSGIGVGTKAGCSNFIISLVHHCPLDLAPFTGKIMGALLSGLHDRNAAIRKCYASALGHTAKIAKDSSVEKLIERLKSWYMEKDDEAAHHACGLTLQAISQHSPDVLKKHGALAMPLAFFAMHEARKTDGRVAPSGGEEETTVWQEVWLDSTPGTEGGLRLYLEETVQLLRSALDSPSWPTKAQAARAMGTVATKLGTSLCPPHLGNLLNALLGALGGRTWDGKESVLQALSTVCTSCSLDGDSRPEGQPSTDQVVEAVLKESRKEKLGYKEHSVRCLGAVLHAYRIDRFSEVWEILTPILDKKPDPDKDKEEEEESHSLEELLSFEETGYKVLGQAWPSVRLTQEKHQEELATLIATKLPKSLWKVQLVMLRTTQVFLKRLMLLEDAEGITSDLDLSTRIVNMLLSQAVRCLGNLKYSAIRQEALAVIEVIVQKLADAGSLALLSGSWKELVSALSVVSRNSRSELQDRAKAVEGLLAQCEMDWS